MLHIYNGALIIVKKKIMDKTSRNLHIKFIFSQPQKCRNLLEIRLTMLRLLVDTGGFMTTASPNPDENGPSRMKRIMNYNIKEDIESRLPHEGENAPPETPSGNENSRSAGSGRPWWNSGVFPVFWTVASVLSLLVNIFLCLLVFGLVTMREPITKTVTGQTTDVLGGLFSNFQAMDRAVIRTNVKVNTSIPLSIQVPVQTRTSITLAEPAVIQSPRVLINTSVLRLDAPAQVTLPAGTPLTVDLNFMLPVQNSIPIQLDVPVEIPLKDTDLHQPFVGLQEVVRPWYCVFLPKSDTLYVETCANTISPIPTGIFNP
jgi:hypothetical protein